MIPKFDWAKTATGQNLCDALKAISICETGHPKCQNEYVGLAYGIANVSKKMSHWTNQTLFHILVSTTWRQ